MGGQQRLVIIVAAAALAVGLTGTAFAVSTGGYKPNKQDCPANADANTFHGTKPGCHNFKLNVSDSAGHRYAQFGIDQESQNTNPQAFDFSVTPNGAAKKNDPKLAGHVDTHWQPLPPGQCGFFSLATYPLDLVNYLAGQGGKPCTLDPTKWQLPSQSPTVTPTVATGTPNGSLAGLLTGADIYLGADDNLDSGEHDGVDGKYNTDKAVNGPSDGGNLEVGWHPLAASGWSTVLVGALMGSPAALAALGENPMPLFDAGGGACADGICVGAYSARRTIYQGGGGAGASRDAYNYDGKTWGPYDCSSGDAASEKACSDPAKGGDPGGMNAYRAKEAKNVVVEPGVQVYEDPDPQGSPVLPTSLYPLPALYVGSCGVVLGGSAVQVPGGNSKGQLVVDPAKC
jgi:hypothetical protein